MGSGILETCFDYPPGYQMFTPISLRILGLTNTGKRREKHSYAERFLSPIRVA